MDVSELSSLFTNITKHIKLCQCPETVKKNASQDDKNVLLSNGSCLTCNTPISAPEMDIVLKMKSIFHRTLQEIGIDLNSISVDEPSDDGGFSENLYYKIDYDPRYLKRNNKGETPLHTAAGKKDVQRVVNLLKNNVNPNTQDNAGWTPLHEAVFKDNLEMATELLSAGAIVNAPGYTFTTPLHIAVHHNNREMTRLLLKFGANFHSRDIKGHTPIQFAESPEIKSILKEYSDYPNIIETSKRSQKKIAPRQITVYLTQESLISVEEQNRLTERLNMKFSKNLDKEVTHVIVEHLQNNVCEPTFQVLKSMLMGCAIVNLRWLKTCLKYSKLINFGDYEVNGTTKFPRHNGPRLARHNFLEMNPPLFMECSIYLKKMNNMENIKELVICGGAKLLIREPHPEHSPTDNFMFHCKPGQAMESTLSLILYEIGNREPELKYNMKHIKTLPIEWFLDCIQTFSIMDHNEN